MAKLSMFVRVALLVVFGISVTDAKNLGDGEHLFNKCIKSGGICYDSSECCNNLKCDESPDSKRRCHYVPSKDELEDKIKNFSSEKKLRSSNLRAKTIVEDECIKIGDSCSKDRQCCGDAKCHNGVKVLQGICHLVPTAEELKEGRENLKPVPKGDEPEPNKEECEGIKCTAEKWLRWLVSKSLSKVKSLLPSFRSNIVLITSAVPSNDSEIEGLRPRMLKYDASKKCVGLGDECGGSADCCNNLTCRKERSEGRVIHRCAYVPSVLELSEKIKNSKRTAESEEDSSEVGEEDKVNKGRKSGRSSKRIAAEDNNTDDDDEVDSKLQLNKEPVESLRRKRVGVKKEKVSKIHGSEEDEDEPKRKSGKSEADESEESEETLVSK